MPSKAITSEVNRIVTSRRSGRRHPPDVYNAGGRTRATPVRRRTGSRPMATAGELTGAELAVYRAATRRRHDAERQALVPREQRAWNLARHAATVLRDRLRAEQVVVFGSLVHPGSFTAWSDVDLAVWGLDPRDTLRAMELVRDLDGDIPVNLVDLAACAASLRRVVEREGQPVRSDASPSLPAASGKIWPRSSGSCSASSAPSWPPVKVTPTRISLSIQQRSICTTAILVLSVSASRSRPSWTRAYPRHATGIGSSCEPQARTSDARLTSAQARPTQVPAPRPQPSARPAGSPPGPPARPASGPARRPDRESARGPARAPGR